jgi:hypothetical protein
MPLSPKAPTIEVVPGFMGTPHIKISAGRLLWGRIRRAADVAGCIRWETWGLITKDIKVGGSVKQINRFLELAWEDEELREQIMGAFADAT